MRVSSNALRSPRCLPLHWSGLVLYPPFFWRARYDGCISLHHIVFLLQGFVPIRQGVDSTADGGAALVAIPAKSTKIVRDRAQASGNLSRRTDVLAWNKFVRIWRFFPSQVVRLRATHAEHHEAKLRCMSRNHCGPFMLRLVSAFCSK